MIDNDTHCLSPSFWRMIDIMPVVMGQNFPSGWGGGGGGVLPGDSNHGLLVSDVWSKSEMSGQMAKWRNGRR